MKFHSGISKEIQTMLTNDLQCYAQEVKMSKSEYKELCQWVQAGHSPYDNGWAMATDWGTPMDYISAKRIVESGMDLVAAFGAAEPIFYVREDGSETTAGDELPF